MNPHNDPRDISDRHHTILNRIAWFLAILFTMKVTVMMWNGMPQPMNADRWISFAVPAVLISFVTAVILKAILHGLSLIAHRMAEKDYNKYHKGKDKNE